MSLFKTFVLTLSLIILVSCSSALKQQQIDQWLNTISEGKPPEMDITGQWRDRQGTGMFTWGQGSLWQKEDKVSGVIGDYNVTGIVSGRIVYLVFLHGGTVYYTARLEMSQESLSGRYFKAKDQQQRKGYAASFVRIADPTVK